MKRNTRSATLPLVLASTSPRRIELLGQIRYPIEVRSPETDETPKRGENPSDLVKRLSTEKAQSIRTSALADYEQCLILGADTIVVADQKILGKPKDAADATRMLKRLAGKTHTVLTGFCILSCSRTESDQKAVQVVRSKVTMRPMTPAMIKDYVHTGEPLDRAGSYAAQGIGMAFVQGISGSYTNVIGLPVAEVCKALEKHFQVRLFSWVKATP